MSEEHGRLSGVGGVLIPEKAEASSGLEMAERATREIREDDLHSETGAQVMEEGLAPRVGEEAGAAEQRHTLLGKPSPHQLPMMEVGGEEEGGSLFEAEKLSGVRCPNMEDLAISAMQESKEIQGGMMVQMKAQ
jgi:hypothetical protein